MNVTPESLDRLGCPWGNRVEMAAAPVGAGGVLLRALARGGDVPLGVFVLIGGMAGLPNVLSLQQALNSKAEDESES
jgi:hypothetical protein